MHPSLFKPGYKIWPAFINSNCVKGRALMTLFKNLILTSLMAVAIPLGAAEPVEAKSAAKLKPIMNAKEFTGETRKAYELAKKYATTLPHIRCHCGCMETMHHKSLHDCF